MDPSVHPKSKISDKIRGILFSIGTACFLTIFKLGVGISTQSMGLIASAVDSLMDVLVSTVNFISLREADKPADAEHLYGHGKIESLAGLFQSLIISLSGVYIIVESVKRLVYGDKLQHVPIAIIVMFVSMICTYFLVRKLKKIARESESIIMTTESLHFTTDLLTNGGVIVALVLVSLTQIHIWDLIVALMIAAYILSQSLRIFKTSINELIDRALSKEEQKFIEEIIMNYDSHVIGFHNLRTRKIGKKKFIDFHVQIDGIDSFRQAHKLTEGLIEKIESQIPDSDITVHYDPEDDSKSGTNLKD